VEQSNCNNLYRGFKGLSNDLIFFVFTMNLFIFMCFVHGKAKWSHSNEVKCIIHTCNCTYTLKCLHIIHLFKLPKFPSTTQHCSSSHHPHTQKSKKFSNNFYLLLLFTYVVMLAWLKRFCKTKHGNKFDHNFLNDFLSTFHFYNTT
jgi:hypothetical protein